MISVVIPIRTSNPLNGSQGRTRGGNIARARQRKAQRGATKLMVESHMRAGGSRSIWAPALVTVTRIAPRQLDAHDGLRAALKGVVDGIADALGLASDRDERVTWEYGQRRGKPWEYAVEIRIEERRATGT